jgi:hypothetical protein
MSVDAVEFFFDGYAFFTCHSVLVRYHQRRIQFQAVFHVECITEFGFHINVRRKCSLTDGSKMATSSLASPVRISVVEYF